MKGNRTEAIIYTILCLSVLLLYVSKYMIFGVGILAILGAFILLKKRIMIIPKQCGFFFAFIVINVIQSFFAPYTDLVQEIERNIIYLALAIVLYNINISYKSFLIIWRAMLVFCLAIQLLQFFGLFNINTILEQIYGSSVFLKVAGYTSIRHFRSGSIFIAINPYFKFTAISLAICFYDLQKEDGNKIMDYIFIVISFISTLMSGSRTGFAVLAVISVIYLFGKMKTNAKAKATSIIRIVLVTIAFLGVFIFLNQRYNLSDARMFNAGDSLGYKFNVIKNFFSNASPTQILYGMGAYDVSISNTSLNMDSDIGYVLSYFGVVGFVIYYCMLWNLVGIKKAKEKPERSYLIMLLVVLVLSGITSGIYFNYRVFSTILLAIIPFHASIINSKEQTDLEVDSKGSIVG